MTPFTCVESNLRHLYIGLNTREWGHVAMTTHVKWEVYSRTMISTLIIPISVCYYCVLPNAITSLLKSSIFTNKRSIGCLIIKITCMILLGKLLHSH